MSDSKHKWANTIAVLLLSIVLIYFLFPFAILFSISKCFGGNPPPPVQNVLMASLYPVNYLTEICPPYERYCRKQLDILWGPVIPPPDFS